MEFHGVIVRSIRMLRGPNLYASMPVMQITIDIGSYEDLPSNRFPGAAERFTAWLPGLEAHECSLHRPGGFVERLRRGTYLAHIVEHVTLELQDQIGFDVSFGQARSQSERGIYTIVVAYQEEEPARAAFETALRLSLAAFHDRPFDMTHELEQLHALADDYRLGPSTAAIVAAARRRNIPIVRLTPQDSLVQLGWGIYQRRIQASETSNTSAIAVDMCQDKALTSRMLSTVGVPVPESRSVTSPDQAWQAAQEIGLPVVLKPEDGNQGNGVSVNLSSETDVRAAYQISRTFCPRVLVERFVVGQDYRLLIVNGRMIAAARRDPVHVVGNGTHTITQLAELVNADPRRRPGHSSTLTQIRLDDSVDLVLAQQGLNCDSVPGVGQVVPLRTNANLSTGGTATDVTDSVHPLNSHEAQLAAQIMGLDIAGIDIVCQDIRRPLHEQGGAIVEVNAAPGLRMHLYPVEGYPRDIATPIVDMLYPPHAPARIPIIAVTGTNGKTTVTRLIAHLYETAHKVVGMTSTEGVSIGGERIMAGDCSGPKSAQAVLLHPRVEVAVLETARGGILREGLAFDACRVGVVTNISADHLGLGGVETLKDLALVKQVVVEAVESGGAAVLNAEDSLVAEMAAATSGEVVYFSSNPRQHIVASHLDQGGRCVLVDNGSIVLAHGEDRIPLVELDRIGFTAGGLISFQVQNALAATAAAWAGGLNPAIIARGLSTFASDEQMVPGRFNLLEIGGVQVALDYGHNVAALQALSQAVQSLGPRHTLLVMGLPGDRRDEDLLATINATLSFGDTYVLYDLDDLRGRERRQVPRMLSEYLPAERPCIFASSQREGILRGWQRVKPGDRMVVIVDQVDEALELIHTLAAAVNSDAACVSPIGHERAVDG